MVNIGRDICLNQINNMACSSGTLELIKDHSNFNLFSKGESCKNTIQNFLCGSLCASTNESYSEFSGSSESEQINRN